MRELANKRTTSWLGHVFVCLDVCFRNLFASVQIPAPTHQVIAHLSKGKCASLCPVSARNGKVFRFANCKSDNPSYSLDDIKK